MFSSTRTARTTGMAQEKPGTSEDTTSGDIFDDSDSKNSEKSGVSHVSVIRDLESAPANTNTVSKGGRPSTKGDTATPNCTRHLQKLITRAPSPEPPAYDIAKRASPSRSVLTNRHYVVVKGLEVGIFKDWYGFCHIHLPKRAHF